MLREQNQDLLYYKKVRSEFCQNILDLETPKVVPYGKKSINLFPLDLFVDEDEMSSQKDEFSCM